MKLICKVLFQVGTFLAKLFNKRTYYGANHA
jgi:hypothetical protein